MSVQALSWAIERAPVPAKLVPILIGLANHADADGRGAYPTVGRLAYYCRKSRRQTQSDLRELVSLNLARLGDQRLVAHIDPRYRPTVYDLDMNMVRAPYGVTELSDYVNRSDPDRDRPDRSEPRRVAPNRTEVDHATPDRSEPRRGAKTTADRLSAILAYKPRWTSEATKKAIEQAIAQGMAEDVAYAVLESLAKGDYGPTAVPNRLLAAGPWWQPGSVFIPRGERSPRCERHRGEPASNCGVCAAERKASTAPSVPPPSHNPTRVPENARRLFASGGYATRERGTGVPSRVLAELAGAEGPLNQRSRLGD